MKKLIFTLLILAGFCCGAFSQNIKKAYMTRQQENGTLYFIVPQDVFSNRENGSFTLDIVKLSTSDSVRLNYTVTLKEISPVDSLSFIAPEINMALPVEKIFIRPGKRSSWEHRYTLVMPYGDMQAVFTARNSPRIVIHSGGADTEYSAKGKVWKAYCEKIGTIVAIMSANR
ncbi:MAG: hypothetical protein LUE10_02890 [Alistipes sp.]|nr:hypothetical protein [Alistipes sp.]